MMHEGYHAHTSFQSFGSIHRTVCELCKEFVVFEFIVKIDYSYIQNKLFTPFAALILLILILCVLDSLIYLVVSVIFRRQGHSIEFLLSHNSYVRSISVRLTSPFPMKLSICIVCLGTELWALR